MSNLRKEEQQGYGFQRRPGIPQKISDFSVEAQNPKPETLNGRRAKTLNRLLHRISYFFSVGRVVGFRISVGGFQVLGFARRCVFAEGLRGV